MLVTKTAKVVAGHEHSKDVTNIEILSPTSTCRQDLCSLFFGYNDTIYGEHWPKMTRLRQLFYCHQFHQRISWRSVTCVDWVTMVNLYFELL